MDILQAAIKLRPGTSWNFHGDINTGEGVLEQADDGTPRVAAPTMQELQSIMGQPDSALVSSAKAVLQNKSASSDDKLSALTVILSDRGIL